MTDSTCFVSANSLNTQDNKQNTHQQTEKNYLNTHKYRIKLFNPKELHQFKHIEIKYWHSIFHFFTLCISIIVSSWLILEFFREIRKQIPNLGVIYDITTIDVIAISLITFYLFQKLKILLAKDKEECSFRYKLALCANAFNKVLLDITNILILLFAVIGIIFSSTIENHISCNEIFFSQYQSIDTIDAFVWIILYYTIHRSFKFLSSE